MIHEQCLVLLFEFLLEYSIVGFKCFWMIRVGDNFFIEQGLLMMNGCFEVLCDREMFLVFCRVALHGYF